MIKQHPHLNWTSGRTTTYQSCFDPKEHSEGRNSNPSLLVSPLVVAGIVIGLVLVLSCVTIIVCRLRKDGRLRNPHMRADDSYAPDGLSYGGSIGELRSTCLEEFTPVFGSYVETLSQVNVMYPDSPPCYDECVGPGATQIYVPTDDPPPYSWEDPYKRRELCIRICSQAEVFEVVRRASSYSATLQEIQPPISSISRSSLTHEADLPYQTIACEQNVPIPLIPMEVLKNSAAEHHPAVHGIF